MNNIPVGAAVYGTGINSNGCGHSGIYIGNGMVRDSVGRVREMTLEEWLENQTDKIDGKVGWLGWGWQVVLPDADTNNENDTNNTEDADENNIQEIVEIENSYSVIVATWKEEREIIESDDTEVSTSDSTTYYMTTESINYQEFVSGYTMPFDFLWALTVTGRDKDFTLEIADLVFDSEIIITIHDNLTTTTSITTQYYTKTVTVGEEEIEQPYWRRDTTIVRDNTINIALTRADVWCVDYYQSFLYTIPDEQHSESTSGSGNNRTEYSHTVTSNKYLSSPPTLSEKLDPGADEPNFATILNKREYYQVRNNIMSAPDWLFDIIETMDVETVDLLDLTKYVLYRSTNKDFGVTSYNFPMFDNENFEDITSGSTNESTGAAGTPESSGEAPVEEGGKSLNTSSLSKDEFIAAMQAFYDKTGNEDFYNNFLQHAGEIYDISVQNNISPELVVVTARQVGNFEEAGGSYNYWGVNTSNSDSQEANYSSLAEGIAGYAELIHKYETGYHAEMIIERYQERKAAGCDPLGYGLPGTLSGMQSIYAYVGDHVEGGHSGYYMLDPDIAGVTAVYSTHEEFLEKCAESGLPEHAYGTETTPWEQGQYTAWQVKRKLEYWNEIFGT